jgi:HEAT repeat protein
MSKKKNRRTAEEVMAELEQDPEYVRRRAAIDEKFRRLEDRDALLERPILAKLRSRGYVASSIKDALEKFAPLPPDLTEVLLRTLEACEDDRIRESVVRALGAAANPFDGRTLVKCYESTHDEGLRFAILNTIALSKVHSINDWLAKARRDPYLHKTLENLGYCWWPVP